jgi:hypothetical protein
VCFEQTLSELPPEETGDKNRVGQQPKRKEILCAVAIKLIKVIFALLRDKRTFDDGVRVIAAHI